MIQPSLKDDAFLADVAAARGEFSPTRLFVWWLGQSGFLVAHAGEFLLFDPYLSDSLTKKYAATDKPHVRMTARVVDPARLGFVSVVTSSHNHTDHFDAETLLPLFAAAPGAKLVLPAVNVRFAQQRLSSIPQGDAGGVKKPIDWGRDAPVAVDGRNATGASRPQEIPRPGASAPDRLVPLGVGERATVGVFTFEAVPAAHEELAPDFAGFVVSVGPFRIYHSGDTVLFPGIVERLRPFAIDLALLPVNGRAPERRVSGNLDGAEAAQLAHDIGARCVVPCHYEMFTFNTASPELFRATCARFGQRCAVLRAGERLVLDASR
ncbi:MAG: MBL fold metallo-hydrolase [Opitutus sp.]|nr:MBL fold metallo-hydrolase [Opitutus sp.]